MAATKSSSPEMKEPNILGRYSIKHIFDELCTPRLTTSRHEDFIPPKYMHIRKLIPVVLDLNKVQYTCWSTHFRNAARDKNLLHHIDPTIPTPPLPDINIITSIDEDDTTLWCKQDAVVITWIYATISPYLLFRLCSDGQITSTATAMDYWACLRDICQQYNTTMQKKKRRYNYIDLTEDYDQDDAHVDFISNLPDDVLVYVLSLTADMKTAGRTSILSRRWIHVWTHLMHLDFDDTETLATWHTLKLTSFAQPEMDKFVDQVNRVINANRAPYLDTFRIHFALNSFYSDDIDNWLKFAFLREVRHLVLDFFPSSPMIHIYKILSTNPASILNTTLQSLHLKSVTILGPLQRVLTNCVNLQRLSLQGCMASGNNYHSKLVVSSSKLKHLKFVNSLKVLNIKSLHLSAPNLSSFILYEPQIDAECRCVPSVVDATFGGPYLHHMDTLHSFSSQLQKLSLRWYKASSSSVFRYFPTKSGYTYNSGFPTFVNVRQLEVIFLRDDDDLLSLTSLIEACPLLHTFTLKLMMFVKQQPQWPMLFLAPTHAQVNAIRSHQHLKVVEFVGYAGFASAAELALRFARHASMLRRFIFDTRQPQLIGKPCERYTSSSTNKMVIMRTTELLAKQIRGIQGLVDVVIL